MDYFYAKNKKGIFFLHWTSNFFTQTSEWLIYESEGQAHVKA